MRYPHENPMDAGFPWQVLTPNWLEAKCQR